MISTAHLKNLHYLVDGSEQGKLESQVCDGFLKKFILVV